MIAYIIIGIVMLFIIFKRDYREKLRHDIVQVSVSSIIKNVYYFKDENGSGIATQLSADRIPFCFSGRSLEFDADYFGFAKAGDSLSKKSNSDTIILKRNRSTYLFKIYACK